MSIKPPNTHPDTAATVTGHLIRLGLSRTQLAGRLGVTRTTVSRWATGATRPDGHTLRALARLRPRVAVNATDLETVTEWFEDWSAGRDDPTPSVFKAFTRLRKAAQEKHR